MRAIIAAIALVLAIGAVMPTTADARPPSRAEKWGCTFKATLGFDALVPDKPAWGGAGETDCDERQTLVYRMAMFQDIPGQPDRLTNKDTWVLQQGPGGTHEDATAMLPGGWCRPGGPPKYPYFFRMIVERKGKPGAVWVATRNSANPCPEGTWPHGYGGG